MAGSMEKVAADALELSAVGRAWLVEQLLASLEGETEPRVERAHLDEIRQRRFAVQEGQAKLVDGEDALRRARMDVRK
jgi:hypothetical protein